MTMPKVMTRKEAARATKLSIATIDRALQSGALPAKVHGGRTLILESGVEQFLEQLQSYKAAGRNTRARKPRNAKEAP